MNIKILFSDLDGTLVEHAGDVTEDTIKYVKKLVDNGVQLILVSGRHADLIKSIHHNLGIKTPVIGCNGGMIKDLITNEVLFKNEIPKETIKKSIEIAEQLGVNWVVYEQNNIFFDKMPPKSYKLPYVNSELPEKLRANFVKLDSVDEMFSKERVFIKTLILFDNNMDVIEKGNKLLSELEDVQVLRSAEMYLDVMPKGSSKGQAIKSYLEMINISKDNVASIGDAENDLDMIEFAGLGIAMGNAIDNLKDIAQYVTSKQPEGFKDAVDYIISKNN